MYAEQTEDERNPMLLSSEGTSGTVDDFSKIYPNLPEGYFSDKGDVLKKPKSICERYRDTKVKPYVSVVDFNNSADAPYENKPKLGYEVGLKFSF